MGAARLRCRTVVLAPGRVVHCPDGAWDDTLVVVCAGELEVECHSGQRARFDAGAVLTLAYLKVRSVRNPGREPLVLRTVTRDLPTEA